MTARRRKKSTTKSENPSASPQTNKPSPAATKSAGGSAGDSSAGNKSRRSRSRSRSSRKQTPQALFERFQRLVAEYPPPARDLKELIKFYQQLRPLIENDTLTEPAVEEIFYLIATAVEILAEEELDTLFNQSYRERLMKIRRDHGLGDHEFWDPEEHRRPDEYVTVYEEFRSDKRNLLAEQFEAAGEGEMARLVKDEYQDYRARLEQGKQRFLARCLPPEKDPLRAGWDLPLDDE